jgi:surface antigen/uncharacterized protein YukE
MATFEGLDVQVVQQQGNALKLQAQQLDSIVNNINGLVAHLTQVWQGHDAQTFAGWWQQQHRPALTAASQAISGLGQSALNNASEQSHASSASGASSSLGAVATAGIAAGGAVIGAAAAGAVAATAAGATIPAASLAAYKAGAGLHASSADWAQGSPANGMADKFNEAANNCTSWADFRREQMGLPVVHGNGKEMASNAGLVPGGVPQVGSLVSDTAGSYGHVMVVEQVVDATPGHLKMVISEMNYNGNGAFSSNSVLTENANGSWTKLVPDVGRSMTYSAGTVQISTGRS